MRCHIDLVASSANVKKDWSRVVGLTGKDPSVLKKPVFYNRNVTYLSSNVERVLLLVLRGAMAKNKVLIVDDESSIREMLRLSLETSNFDCIEAEDISEAYHAISNAQPDIVLLDWMLPGGSGIELVRRLKKDDVTASLPVIMLTAKAHVDNITQCLDLGVDDYITKPFAPKELIARIKAILRRASGDSVGAELRVGELVLQIDSRRVILGVKALNIGPTEFNLLELFMANPERAYSRSQLLDLVWGVNAYVGERTVDVYIRRLRKALNESNEAYSRLIQTVRGTGYRFSTRDVDLS